MRVGIYGTGERQKQHVERIAEDNDIVFYVQTDPDKDMYCHRPVIKACDIDYSLIDYLIVCVDDGRNDIWEHLRKNDKNWEYHKNKVINYFEFIFQPWIQSKRDMPYRSVENTNGLKFIFHRNDEAIPKIMLCTANKTYASREIDQFFSIAAEKCGYSECEKGIFLDIGANVGTTAVYVKKKKAPQLDVYAVEACKETYDILRMNLIANDTESVKASWYAISDKAGTADYKLRERNWGGRISLKVITEK